MDSKIIYIVDDEPDILSLYKEALEDKVEGIIVESFTEGGQCLGKIEQGLFPHLVITDLKMPQMNGHQLAKKILNLNASIPLILNTNHGRNIPNLSGIKVGYRYIIDKQVPIDTFVESVNKILEKLESGGVKNYLKIDYESIYALDNAPFNIKVRLNDGKFVSLIKSGDTIPKEKLKQYEERGVNSYYIELEEFTVCHDSVYLPFPVNVLIVGEKIDFDVYLNVGGNIKRLIPKETQIRKEHLELLKKHSFPELLYEDAHEKAYIKYLDRMITFLMKSDDDGISLDALQSYSSVKKRVDMEEILRIVDLIETFVAKNKEIDFGKLSRIFSENSLKHHSIRVALLMIGIISKIVKMRNSKTEQRFVSQIDKTIQDGKETRNLLITASMVHDLGEGSGYDKIVNCVEYLKKRKEIGAKVVEIVSQHQEKLDGSGGPHKLIKRQIGVYAQILALVNYYDQLVMEGNRWQDAIIEIQMNGTLYNVAFANILKRIIEN